MCWSFTEQRPCHATSSSYPTFLTSHMFDNVVLNQHTCPLLRPRTSSHACLLKRTSNNICYNWTKLTGMLGTVALDQRACLFKYYPASVHVCSTFSRPADQASFLQSQQTYSPLRMFDYAALNQHTCLKPSSYVCNSFKRLAGMLQYRCFKRCF